MNIDFDSFAEPGTLEAMDRLRLANPLVIFAGAGVPASVDIPTWEQLLRELLADFVTKGIGLESQAQKKAYVEALMDSYSAPFLGSLVRDALPDPTTFAREMHRHIYDVRREHFRTSFGANFPRALGELLLQRHAKGFETVLITTNFDDCIEYIFNHDKLIRSINRGGVVLKPRYRAALPKRRALPIHYIHGYLPRSGDIPIKQELIFSERDFSRPWDEHWSHDLLYTYARHQWLFVGISFQDPHISFYLTQRHIAAPNAPSPIGLFSLQGKRWRALQDSQVREALLEAELARLRELGMRNVLITRYYFQDAHFLREVAQPPGLGGNSYCDRRRDWFARLESTYLKKSAHERLVRSAHFNAVLLGVRQLMERNLREVDPKNKETIKVELYARDPQRRGLFLTGSSEGLLLDPTRSRRFELTLNDDRAAAAVKAFTRGTPCLVEKTGPHVHGRWNGFWATPILLGSPPWFGFPVGPWLSAQRTTWTRLRFDSPFQAWKMSYTWPSRRVLACSTPMSRSMKRFRIPCLLSFRLKKKSKSPIMVLGGSRNCDSLNKQSQEVNVGGETAATTAANSGRGAS